MRSIERWYFKWPWGTLIRFSRSWHFWSRISEKRRVLETKLLFAQEETIPNIWNDTMFGDLDWHLNASRGFVYISWASCFECLRAGYSLCVLHFMFAELERTVTFFDSFRSMFYLSCCSATSFLSLCMRVCVHVRVLHLYNYNSPADVLSICPNFLYA